MGGRRRGRGALLPTGEGREGKGIRENREGKEREEPGRKGGGEEGTGIGPQFEKNDPPPRHRMAGYVPAQWKSQIFTAIVYSVLSSFE